MDDVNQWLAAIVPAVGLWLTLRREIRSAVKGSEEKFDLKLDKSDLKLEALRTEMNGRFDTVDTRLTSLESDMTIIKTRLIGGSSAA